MVETNAVNVRPLVQVGSRLSALSLSFLLQSRELARKLVEHGHKGPVLSREEFEERKAAARAATVWRKKV